MYVSLSQETALCGVQCGKVLEFQLDICEDGRIRLVRVLFFGAKPNCRRCIVKVRRPSANATTRSLRFVRLFAFPDFFLPTLKTASVLEDYHHLLGGIKHLLPQGRRAFRRLDAPPLSSSLYSNDLRTRISYQQRSKFNDAYHCQRNCGLNGEGLRPCGPL